MLARYDVESRMAEKRAFIDSMKSGPEKLFEGITEGDHPILAIDTHLLASSQVSYDPENIVEVDEHRMVHKRVIRIEYSGGTHVHVIGRPIAAQTLSIELPDPSIAHEHDRQFRFIEAE